MTEALFVSDNTTKIMKYSKYVQVTTLKSMVCSRFVLMEVS